MQRQLALQRLQEQEREMAARMEQQKQLTHIRQMQAPVPQCSACVPGSHQARPQAPEHSRVAHHPHHRGQEHPDLEVASCPAAGHIPGKINIGQV